MSVCVSRSSFETVGRINFIFITKIYVILEIVLKDVSHAYVKGHGQQRSLKKNLCSTAIKMLTISTVFKSHVKNI